MQGTYSALPAWKDGTYSSLAFSVEALKAGRAKAVKVWNDTPTDCPAEAGKTGIEPLIDDNGGAYGELTMVEHAAYAYAVMNECLRVDGSKAPFVVGGLQVDPAPNFLAALPVALEVAREYAKWVERTKPVLALKKLQV
jgi:hypothetical protein